MKVKKTDNETIKKLLKDRDDIYNSILNDTFDFDDEELKRVKRAKYLEKWEFDVLYLSSKLPVREVADLYAVSSAYVYSILNKIQIKLSGNDTESNIH